LLFGQGLSERIIHDRTKFSSSKFRNPHPGAYYDDHDLVRTGLKFFLLASEDLELVGEAASGEEAVQLCAQIHPRCVLMDVMMPG